MLLKRPRGHPGTFVVLELHSRILKGNPLGDYADYLTRAIGTG